jgi:sugar phosphate permease
VGRIPFLSRGRSTGVWTAAFFLGQFVTPLVIAAIMGALSIQTAVAVGVVGIACAVVAVLLALVVKPGPLAAESEGADPVAAS